MILRVKSIIFILCLVQLLSTITPVSAEDTISQCGHSDIGFSDDDLISLPIDLTFSNLKRSIIKLYLLDKNNEPVSIENPMIYQYFTETLSIKDEGEVEIDIKTKLVFEEFYNINDYNFSNLEGKSHVELKDFGAAHIPSGSLKISDNRILINSPLGFATNIKRINNIKLTYESGEKIQTSYVTTEDKNSFYILLPSNESHFVINESTISLEINYLMEGGVIDSFFSNDLTKKIMIINQYLDYYAFSVKITVNLPKDINLVSADRMQVHKGGDKLYYAECITESSSLDSFTIEYLEYNDMFERVFSDPIPWFFAFIGGFVGGVLIEIIRFGYKLRKNDKTKVINNQKNRSYRKKEWLEKEIKNGKTPDQIANECGVTKNTVRKWMKRYDIKIKI